MLRLLSISGAALTGPDSSIRQFVRRMLGARASVRPETREPWWFGAELRAGSSATA
jgi:hypothetical protein